MDKRFQVFVSSTYADLREERQQVIQALMEMDCIPAGMELFPAADEEQWEFIKKVIEDCDYYLLIIGGRYGSITNDGISYTEKEFDYAVECGLKVVALIHGEPENIPFGKSEKDPEVREKLLNFRDKVMTGRLVKFWKTAEDLPGQVALSMTKTIKMYPAIGWVRANHVASENILTEINDLRKKNAELQKIIDDNRIQQELAIDDIADIDAIFTIHGRYTISKPGYSRVNYTFTSEISWREIFSLISPYLVEHPIDSKVSSKLAESLLRREGKTERHISFISIDEQEFKTITIQLESYGLVKTNYSKSTKGDMCLFWSLTSHGHREMIKNRVIRNDA